MAYVTGTADNYVDLLARLETFLTSNATLVSLGQAWTTQRFSNGPSATAFPFTRVAFGQVAAGNILDAVTGVFPSSNFKLRVTGSIVIPTTGSYTFGIDSADAGELLIDGDLAVGWYGSHALAGSFSHSNTVVLTAGTYTFEARLVCATAVYGLAVGWQKPGDPSIATIPAASLSGLQFQWTSYSGSMPSNTPTMGDLWTQKELIIKAPGLSGTESIYLGIQPLQNVSGDYYNWDVRGFVGYSSGALFSDQPGISPASYAYLWNSSIPYWFVANGQRVIVIAKVSTVYQVFYLGKFLPYGLPTQYPYPVVVAGLGNTLAQRWSVLNTATSNFQCPGDGMNLFYTDATWKRVRNRYFSGSETWDASSNINVWPRQEMLDTTSLTSSLSWPDNGYTLLPFILNSPAGNSIGVNLLGEMDGAFWVSGHQNSSENPITVGGENYLCVQNGSRTGAGDYMAVRLV